MKRIILVCAVSLGIGLAAAQAQDSTNRSNPYPQQQPQQQSQSQKSYKDLVKINATDLPDPVRRSLGDSQYSGWEDGMFYRNKNNDMYVVEIGQGNEAKRYSFDKNGKVLPANRPKPGGGQ